MKKRLFTILIISATSLFATLILIFVLYNIGLITYGKTPVSSSSEISSTEKPSSEDETLVSAKPAEPSDVPDNDSTDLPAASPEAPSPDEDEEPVLPEVTADPDMDADTWDYKEGGDYNMLYTDKEDAPSIMPYHIKVNKQMNTVTVYKADKKGKYKKAVKAMVCSAGRDTPLGTYKTSDKYYWKAMIHDVWAQYATRITGKILFHSVPYDTHEKDTLVTSYYNQLGGTASAGCIRLSVEDAKWLIENCPSGTTVEIYNSSDPGPLGKPQPIRIPANCRWDPTDPDDRNPWKNDETTIIGVKDKTIERGTRINIYDGIMAFDKDAKNMTANGIKASKTPDTSKPGQYEVTYSFKPSKGEKIKKKAVFTVVDTQPPKITGLPSKYYVKDASKIDEKYILNKISVTDNGYSLSKKEHVSVTLSGNKAVITAYDDYNHSTTFKCEIIEDSKKPEITLKKGLKTEYPISFKFTESTARKRIKNVSDNVKKLSAKDIDIKIKPSGWGLKITYSVSDDAGNKESISEVIKYETASIQIINNNLVVHDIDDTDALEDNVKVVSNSSNKRINCKLKIKHKKLEGNAQYKQYTVTYTATYKSSAGSKTATATTVVSVPR